jgi:chromosome segregation ATPase
MKKIAILEKEMNKRITFDNDLENQLAQVLEQFQTTQDTLANNNNEIVFTRNELTQTKHDFFSFVQNETKKINEDILTLHDEVSVVLEHQEQIAHSFEINKSNQAPSYSNVELEELQTNVELIEESVQKHNKFVVSAKRGIIALQRNFKELKQEVKTLEKDTEGKITSFISSTERTSQQNANNTETTTLHHNYGEVRCKENENRIDQMKNKISDLDVTLSHLTSLSNTNATQVNAVRKELERVNAFAETLSLSVETHGQSQTTCERSLSLSLSLESTVKKLQSAFTNTEKRMENVFNEFEDINSKLERISGELEVNSSIVERNEEETTDLGNTIKQMS